MEDKDTEEDLWLLFAPGSSLGGARPKASVIDKDEHLAIAKFPRKDDEINTVLWEAVARALAQKAGIPVAPGRVPDGIRYTPRTLPSEPNCSCGLIFQLRKLQSPVQDNFYRNEDDDQC
jgi:hypothetical protein